MTPFMRNSTPPGSPRNVRIELYRDDYVAVIADPDGMVVRIVRTSIAHPSPKVLEDSYLDCSWAMDRYGRTGRGLLLDMREAIGRNGPEYDAPLRRARQRNDAGFLRIAVLLRSQTGMLQLMRISEEDGVVRLLTMSEMHALEYLRHGTLPAEARPPTGKVEARR